MYTKDKKINQYCSYNAFIGPKLHCKDSTRR